MNNDTRPLNIQVAVMSACSAPARNAWLEAMREENIPWTPSYVVNMARIGNEDRAFVRRTVNRYSGGRSYLLGHFLLVEDDDAYVYLKLMERWETR